ncbi:MAG: CHASE domain-containing protein [Burkholderiales bacterium]|nr:CHASE domain-containing protein [Burkholderiales bacterium]
MSNRKPLALHWAAASLLTAVTYVAAGMLALTLAVPPGFASPLYPAAGVALSALLIVGRGAWPGVLLGAFFVNLSVRGGWHSPTVAALAMPAVIAVGATLQALTGHVLIRRFVRQPLELAEPRDVLGFLAASTASCLVSPTIANLALWLSGTVPAAAVPFSAATWWIGDVLGVLIVTPIVLTLLGQPRAAWAPRRLSVGLSLALVTALLTLGILQVARWNNERVQSAFDRDATGAFAAMRAQLHEPLQALEALHSVFVASEDVSPEEMRLATRAWLAPRMLQAIGWSERLRREDVPAFEARARSEGSKGFAVFDRSDAGALAAPAAPGNELLVIRYIEPPAGNSAALGVNVLSIAAARAAVEKARQTALPAATAGFRLTQQLEGENQTGIVIYQALYAPHTPTEAQRASALRGVVFVTLRMDDQLASLLPRIPSYLGLCVVDNSAGQARRRLAGPPGCETSTPAMLDVQPLRYAGRDWELRVFAEPGPLPDTHGGDVWLFALVGLLSTAMLAGFLLTLTGRARRVETAVRERTAALQAEMREREGAEAALRESEQRFRNILNNVPIGVVYTDLNGQIIQANPRFCELTGYKEHELLALRPPDYTLAEDVAQDAGLTAQLVRGEIPMYRRHKRYIAKGGGTVWVQATVSLLRDAQGQPLHIVGVAEDITEHLKLEDAERAREAAEASNRAKSEFLSRMSHELRTPLNAMLGFAQLLELDQRQPLSATQQPWVSQIQQAGWHLLEMINDVLDLSRIESGNLRLHTETLNLGELLSASVAMVEGDAKQRRILIIQELGEGTATVLGDSTRVKQILTNLLSNAVKYNAEAGRIHIASRVSTLDTVEIAVTDTGLGMTPDQLGELFQPFNRLGRERSAQQGTGIGLVISQRLAELMGGSLKARSIAGKGSSFMLTLPSSVDPDTVRSEFENTPLPVADYHRRIVHYVEDNETNVEVMRGILAQRSQVQLEVSTNGRGGLAAIRARRPDLILLDMHLPDISGMELLRELKADARTAPIPVVVVSADALAQQIDAAYQAGCAHYLTKPVSVNELLAVVDDLLERIDTRYG